MIKDISFGDAFKCALGVKLGIETGKYLMAFGDVVFLAFFKSVAPDAYEMLLKKYEKEHYTK